MQSEQFIVSRVSQWANEQRSIQQQSIQTQSACLSTSQQFRKLRHIPMSKLSLNNIFVKKENEKNLYIKQLHPQKVKSQHNYFQQLRQNFENDVTAFVKKYKFNDEQVIAQDVKVESPVQHNISNSESGRQAYGRGLTLEEQRMTSNGGKRRVPEVNTGSPAVDKLEYRKITEGGYFFNNWRSYQKYFCTKASNWSWNSHDTKDNLASHLVYAVIDMDYERGLRIIDEINGNGTMRDIKVKNDQLSSGVRVKDIVVEGKSHKKKASKQKVAKAHCQGGLSQQHKQRSKQNSIHLTSLRIIIKGLQTLSAIIKLTDELNNNTQLAQTFFNRLKFDLFEDQYLNDPKAKMNLLNLNLDEINTNQLLTEYWDISYQIDEPQKDYKKFDKKPSYNTSPNSPNQEIKKMLKSTQNLSSYKSGPKMSKSTEEVKKFLQLSPKLQKICILINLNFLIKFTSKVKISSCSNDYYKLLLCYIKNGADQLQQVKIEYESSASTPPRDGVKMSPYLLHDDEECSNMSQSSMHNKQMIDYSKDIDYMTLLLQLRQIKIYDRVNFASRLLSRAKKLKFVHQLESAIVRFPFLDNLLLFTKFYKEELSKIFEESSSFHYLKDQKAREDIKKNRKNSTDSLSKYYTQNQLQVSDLQIQIKERNLAKESLQKNIKKKEMLSSKITSICQNFIDECGELATIAYLSNEYPCLQKFCDNYRESLLLSYEHDEVQKIDAMKQKFFGDQWGEKKTHLSKKCSPFLSQINFRQEKLNQNPHEDSLEMDSRRCEICSLKIYQDRKECYIECSKCRHGGHIEHVIKWYSSYQNCPNVNCPCVCN